MNCVSVIPAPPHRSRERKAVYVGALDPNIVAQIARHKKRVVTENNNIGCQGKVEGLVKVWAVGHSSETSD